MNIGVTAGHTFLLAVSELRLTVQSYILKVKNALLKSVYCVTENTTCSRVPLAYKIEKIEFIVYLV
jgi:hypothetical protein